MNRTIYAIQELRTLVLEGERLVQVAEVRHVHWKDWSTRVKSLATLLLDRDHIDRRFIKGACDNIDALRDLEEHGSVTAEEASKQRQERLPVILDRLRALRDHALGRRVFLGSRTPPSKSPSPSCC